MITFFRLASRLPLPLLHLLGSALGWIAWLVAPVYRRRFLDNARQAGFSFAEVRGAVGQAGRLAVETPRLWMGAPVPLTWDGAELVEEAHRAGRGLIFLTPHLGCFEVAAQGYARDFGAAHPITVLYRPARKAYLQPLVEQGRQRAGLHAAPTTLAGVKQLIKALRAGDAVGLLPDQVPPDGQGVWAPFFGRSAYTMTLSARLAQQTGAAVVLAWGERLAGGCGYVVHLRRPSAPLAADAEVAAAQINAEMERLIRECPSQYLWSYARYKAPREQGA